MRFRGCAWACNSQPRILARTAKLRGNPDWIIICWNDLEDMNCICIGYVSAYVSRAHIDFGPAALVWRGLVVVVAVAAAAVAAFIHSFIHSDARAGRPAPWRASEVRRTVYHNSEPSHAVPWDQHMHIQRLSPRFLRFVRASLARLGLCRWTLVHDWQETRSVSDGTRTAAGALVLGSTRCLGWLWVSHCHFC